MISFGGTTLPKHPFHCKFGIRSAVRLQGYSPFLVYCRELAPGTVSLTCDRAQGDDSKHDSHYNGVISMFSLHNQEEKSCFYLINLIAIQVTIN